MNRRLAGVAVAGALAVVALAGGDVPVRAQTSDAPAADLEGVLSAEFDAFAARIEYDIPLPVSPGTVPHIVGEVRRSEAGEQAKGLSAAPTHFDAVVGGTYYDPQKDQKGDENLPPQVECFYPGDLLQTRFLFPTNTRPETASAPPTSYATARCAEGPMVELRASGVALDAPSAQVRGSAADGLAAPVKNRLHATAAARASGLSFADGAITIGSVEASGASSVTGKPGDGATEARVTIEDIVAGGIRFSIANDRVIVAGQESRIDSAAAQALVTTVNRTLEAQGVGCAIALTTAPDHFPQGFLLSRKPPAIGLTADGKVASSMRSGMQIVCDIPQEASEPTTFSPQRLQAIIGFVYTGVFADAAPNGFSLGDLVDLGVMSDGSSFALPASTTGPAPRRDASAQTDTAVPALEPAAVAAPTQLGPAPTPRATRTERHFEEIAVAAVPMGAASRALLAIAALVGFAALTHLGLRRLRGVMDG